jgi:hypothetical protein
MATTKSKQALVLQNIAEEGEKLDNVAGAFMKLVKEEKIDSLEKFNPWLEVGYTENGWSSQVGRPGLGVTTLAPAPRAVKQYASMFRAAFKYELKVTEFENVRQMVDAVAAKRKELATPPVKPNDPELKGVMLRSTGHMNGALWHDAIVVIENLNEEDKDDFEQRLRKLVMRFQSRVPKEIRKPKAA